jgi:hypothetical protein
MTLKLTQTDYDFSLQIEQARAGVPMRCLLDRAEIQKWNAASTVRTAVMDYPQLIVDAIKNGGITVGEDGMATVPIRAFNAIIFMKFFPVDARDLEIQRLREQVDAFVREKVALKERIADLEEQIVQLGHA